MAQKYSNKKVVEIQLRIIFMVKFSQIHYFDLHNKLRLVKEYNHVACMSSCIVSFRKHYQKSSLHCNKGKWRHVQKCQTIFLSKIDEVLHTQSHSVKNYPPI